jgi:chorismate dehydratase
LSEQFGVKPELTQLSMSDRWQDASTDAVMIIGDRAMTADPPQFPFVWDLGEAWNSWTGLPFVFAVWAARTDDFLQPRFDRLSGILSQARDRGVENISAIAQRSAAQYGLTESVCHNYLSDNLHFQLGDKEKQGLAAYFRYAANLDVIAPNLELQFHDCQTA